MFWDGPWHAQPIGARRTNEGPRTAADAETPLLIISGDTDRMRRDYERGISHDKAHAFPEIVETPTVGTRL
jgi:hypothetical protein